MAPSAALSILFFPNAMVEKQSALEHFESQPNCTRITTLSSELSMNALRESVVEALGESRLDDAITQSSTALEILLTNAVKMLELRARSWAKKGKTAEELKDALSIVQIYPNHSSGYLYVGKVYTTQGFQDIAMKAFKDGLDHISPTDPAHALLQQEYEFARARSERRIDFINEGPYDIVSCITSHLTNDAMVESVKVSRLWRTMIVENPLLWKVFEVQNTTVSNSLLPVVSHHVEEFRLTAHSRLVSKCLDMIPAGKFSKLRSLKIYHCYVAGGRERNLYENMHDVLSATSETLTHLCIDDSRVKLSSLADILLICRKLTSINLTRRRSNVNWLTRLSLPYTTSLTHLSLYTYDQENDVTQIEKLFCCSPALKYIKLDGFSADILPIIARHCHNLTYLAFNPSYFNDEVNLPDITADSRRHMIFGGRFTTRLILPLLEKFHDTLASLYILHEDSDELDQDLGLWATYSLPQLTKLYIMSKHLHAHIILAALIRQSPGLTDVTLDGHQAPIENDSIDALTQLTQMESLTILWCNIVGDHMSRLLRCCQLRKLAIRFCGGVMGELLMAAAAVKTLVCLRIDVFNQDVVDKMEDFTESLANLPCLREITLEYMELSTKTVRNLCISKSLKEVSFYGCKVSKEGLCILDQHGIATRKHLM
ncbi:hypothetical protein BJV82DRAFT_660679 [Fennellomyces sp. T-0311]|nr:hypothetical protein BJV82DRAFT_660679 [Fennellomyces sp. T-0311]